MVVPAKVEAASYNIVIKHADGTERKVTVTGQPIEFPADVIIVSRTDPHGVITHANQALIDISGYSLSELLGAQHYLLRHPEMPASVYEHMWSTLSSGKRWHGYLKNLCKNGDHYWVKATIMPNIRHGKLIGYTSVRRRPSRSKIIEHEAYCLKYTNS